MKNTSDSRFRNFAEGLCETYQASVEREKLVKAVEAALVDYDAAYAVFADAGYAADTALAAAVDAKAALDDYDKENT